MSEETKPEQASKNAVFGTQDSPLAAGQGIPEMSREQYTKSTLGFEIPIEAVPLPSRGLIYEDGHPLRGKDSVEYKAMTAREEDILMSPALIKKGTVITELIKSCLTNKAIDPSDILSGDRNAIMVAIRATGYDTIYSPSFECPKCEHRNTINVDLNELEIKTLQIQPDTEGQNVFSFQLPYSKKTVQFKFLTVRDEETLLADLNATKKKNIGTPSIVSARLRTSLVAVDGNSNRSYVAQFAQSMPAKDSLALRRFIDENEPGIDMSFDFTCVDCDYSDTIAIPMDSTFFWPNSK